MTTRQKTKPSQVKIARQRIYFTSTLTLQERVWSVKKEKKNTSRWRGSVPVLGVGRPDKEDIGISSENVCCRIEQFLASAARMGQVLARVKVKSMQHREAVCGGRRNLDLV